MARSLPAHSKEEGPQQAYKRRSLEDAVVRILSRDGLDGLTVERVAREAGVAKGTVYCHYHDKEELLDAVKERSLHPLDRKLTELLESSLSPDRKLEAFAMRYLSYFDEQRELFRVLLYERSVNRVYGSRYQRDRHRTTVEQLARVIEAGIASQIFRPVLAIKAATIFLESNFAIVGQRLLSGERTPVEEDARIVADLFLTGLRSNDTKKKRTRRHA